MLYIYIYREREKEREGYIVYIYAYIHIYIYIYVERESERYCMYTYNESYIYVYIYIYTHIHIIYIYTHIHRFRLVARGGPPRCLAGRLRGRAPSRSFRGNPSVCLSGKNRHYPIIADPPITFLVPLRSYVTPRGSQTLTTSLPTCLGVLSSSLLYPSYLSGGTPCLTLLVY